MIIFSHLISELLLVIKQFGYIGIFIGMFIESSFLPFPSEIILIPAGALVAKGEMALFPVLSAGLLGSLAGALVNFFLALFLGRKTIDLLVSRYGKILFINDEKLKKTDDYFRKHGDITTFVGRMIPGVRQLISLPAGFARMNFFRFCLFTIIGAGLWTLLLIYVGYFFGSEISSTKKIIITSITLFISLIVLIFYLLKKRTNNPLSS
jgi:membrane protein DedA with SNARE-associated domain